MKYERLQWWFLKCRWYYTAKEEALNELEEEIRGLLKKSPDKKLLEELNEIASVQTKKADYVKVEVRLEGIKKKLLLTKIDKNQDRKDEKKTWLERKEKEEKKDVGIEIDDEDDDEEYDLSLLLGKEARLKLQNRKTKQRVTTSSTKTSLVSETPLEKKSREWEQEYSDAYGQANPKSRGSKNVMNHEVKQSTVLRELPDRAYKDTRYVQVRTSKSTSDDHFRVVLEVDDNGPLKDGVVAVIWGLSHDENRRNRNFWVYQRASKNDWTYFSGDEKW